MMSDIVQTQSPPCVTKHIKCQDAFPAMDRGHTVLIVTKLKHGLVTRLSVSK